MNKCPLMAQLGPKVYPTKGNTITECFRGKNERFMMDFDYLVRRQNVRK